MSKKNRLKKSKIDLNTRKESKIFLENKWFAIGLIILISTVVYYNSLKVPFILDDEAKIVNNPDIKQLSNIKTKLIYPYNKENRTFVRNDPSRPLVYLTFTLNYYFGKLNPFGYHLFNMLMHTFNAVLLFFLVRKIIFCLRRKDFYFIPFFAALFFAVHPINTSIVTYIFSRSDILATFFYISSLLFLIGTFENNRKLYVFSLLCFILSLFSKQITVTLPATVLIFDYIFLSNFNIRKVIEKKYYHIPFWIVLLLYLLFRYFYFGGIGDLEAQSTWDRYSYLIIQPYIILSYLKLLIIPIGLCIEHGIGPAKLSEFKILASFFLIIALFILAYRTYRKKTDISKIVLFSTLWFFITLSPTSSFFPTTNALVENRLYLSGLGFYLVIVLVYFLIFRKDISCKRQSSWVLFALIGIHISVLGIATAKRNKIYQNPVLLWQDVISKYPKNLEAHNNLGVLHHDKKEYSRAILEYQKALHINPNHARTHNNLGALYYDQKEYTKATKEYQKALEINPDYIDAYYNLGVLYRDQKDYSKAAKEYQKALQINPNHAKTHVNLGTLYHEQKQFAKAIKEFQKALQINPDDTKAHSNLGVLYHDKKEYGRAIKEFKKALQINPDDTAVHKNLGALYKDQKEYAKAIKEFQKVLEINPDDLIIHNNLGVLYYYQKDYKKALQEFEYLLKLNPYNENAKAEVAMLKELIRLQQ